MLAALSDSLATLIDSISSLKQAATVASDAVGLSAEETAALVQQLRQEIAENNPGAEATVEKLLQGVSEDDPLHAPLASIREAIDIFDFVAAAGHIESLPA